MKNKGSPSGLSPVQLNEISLELFWELQGSLHCPTPSRRRFLGILPRFPAVHISGQLPGLEGLHTFTECNLPSREILAGAPSPTAKSLPTDSDLLQYEGSFLIYQERHWMAETPGRPWKYGNENSLVGEEWMDICRMRLLPPSHIGGCIPLSHRGRTKVQETLRNHGGGISHSLPAGEELVQRAFVLILDL
ncbi:unnamed protein product [Caretta caretta]